MIFDEAQQLPPLFSILRSVVDNKRKQNGQYVLLGSASPDLIKQISESLAGRTSFLELTPFLFIEVFNHDPEYSPEILWLKGGLTFFKKINKVLYIQVVSHRTGESIHFMVDNHIQWLGIGIEICNFKVHILLAHRLF